MAEISSNTKVLVIYTGGTIGMQQQQGFLQTSDNFQDLIDENINHKALAALPAFDLINIHPAIDSACITTNHWQQIHQLINDNYQKYCGFVIVHGTDTMAYSASMLSFLLGGLDKPVIFTGSQIPLSEPFNDGQANLTGAITLAATAKTPEVGLFFNGKLLRGNCASKISTSNFTAFKSHQCPALVEINGKTTTYSQQLLPAKRYFYHPIELQNKIVSVFFLTPACDFSHIQNSIDNQSIKGLILVSYGAGNVPGDNAEFIQLLQSTQANDVVVINKSQCYHGQVNHDYAASKPLLDYNVIGAGGMTIEASYCKLLYLLSQNKDNAWVKRNFIQDLRGELRAV